MTAVMNDRQKKLLEAIDRAFPEEIAEIVLDLRDADEIDSYRHIFEEFAHQRKRIAWRDLADADITRYHNGINYLDGGSWLGFLPALLSFSVRKYQDGRDFAVLAFLLTLRPDHSAFEAFLALPKRAAAIAREVLEFLAFDPSSAFAEEALESVLELEARGF